ncbi:hypothetical protein VTN00DRAFT_6900 [Thermoascus crustaceus]|uniref:uncharacterized protein n=1 Tax=Thermoascus crustaceus TaxID=5088 RepID=UPI00374201F2
MPVPLADENLWEGNIRLGKKHLEEYFGLTNKFLPQLPKRIILSKLDSSRDGNSWSLVKGEVYAYKPVAWVPVIHRGGVIPQSDLERPFTRETTTIFTVELFGSTGWSFAASAEASYAGVKLSASSPDGGQGNLQV